MRTHHLLPRTVRLVTLCALAALLAGPVASAAPALALAVQADGKIVVGGEFTTLGGQPRAYVGRLSSATAALQNLAANPTGTTVTWARSGAGPEVGRTTLSIVESVRNVYLRVWAVYLPVVFRDWP